MKVYIKAVSIEDLRKKYPKIPESKFIELINLDPTADYATNRRGKYGPWILKHYASGDLTPNDFNVVRDALVELSDKVQSRKYEQKDLNQYQTVQDLKDAHIAAQNVELELSNRQRQRNAHRAANEAARRRLAGEETNDITALVSEGPWTVYTPNTFAGSMALAEEGCDKTRPYTGYAASDNNMKAKWCTAAQESWYRSYTSKGPLYIFINENDPINKYQSCPASRSWWFDKYDSEHGKSAFLRFMSEHPVIGEFFQVRNVDGVQYLGTTIEGYDPNATEIKIAEGVTTFPNFKLPDSCKKITLPSTITKIPSDVFNRSNVETIISKYILVVDRNAFMNSPIRDIDLSNATDIGANAFRHCKNLTGVTLKSDVNLASYAFEDCDLHGTFTQYPETLIALGTFDKNPELTVIWKDEDAKYALAGIKELVVDTATHPLLVATTSKKGTPIRNA